MYNPQTPTQSTASIDRSIQPDAFYSKTDVARKLGVSEKTVQRMKIPQHIIGHRTRRHRGRDVLRYLELRRQHG